MDILDQIDAVLFLQRIPKLEIYTKNLFDISSYIIVGLTVGSLDAIEISHRL